MSVTGRILVEAAGRLAAAGSPTARLDAEVLLAHVLRVRRPSLLAWPERRLAPEEIRSFEELLARREKGEPVSYLRGLKEFYSLEFKVGPAALIPRPETELLVEEGVKFLKSATRNPQSAIDVGTGTGCLAVCLARELPGLAVLAVDISPEACALARENARKHGVEGQVEVREGDLFEPVGDRGPFDLVVSNPPYIPAEGLAELPRGIRDYEPLSALDGGPGGLEIIRRLVEEAPRCLAPGGLLLFEFGDGQAEAVRRLLEERGAYRDVAVLDDLAGLPRAARAQRA